MMIAAVALLALHALEARGQGNMTGNMLYDVCKPGTGEAPQAICASYVVGAWEGIRLGVASAAWAAGATANAAETNAFVSQVLNVCTPNGITYTQTVDIFFKALDSKPETRHESARTLLLGSMQEAFPCQ